LEKLKKVENIEKLEKLENMEKMEIGAQTSSLEPRLEVWTPDLKSGLQYPSLGSNNM